MDTLFDREILIIGDTGIEKLRNSRVAVFGVGGVGSYVAEALARAGVGHIALIDGDKVTVSNINRQLVALHSTVGLMKTEIMAQRMKDINPDIKIETFNEFYSNENYSFFNIIKYDFIVDAIDSVRSKLYLICNAVDHNIPIISCMGAGNRLDPTRFRITDIYKTEGCPLARKMRLELRKAGIKKLPVVFSDEQPLPHFSGADSNVVGSISFVPSCAGMVAAGYVIKSILKI